MPFYPFLGEGSPSKIDYRKTRVALFYPLYWTTLFFVFVLQARTADPSSHAKLTRRQAAHHVTWLSQQTASLLAFDKFGLFFLVQGTCGCLADAKWLDFYPPRNIMRHDPEFPQLVENINLQDALGSVTRVQPQTNDQTIVVFISATGNIGPLPRGSEANPQPFMGRFMGRFWPKLPRVT